MNRDVMYMAERGWLPERVVKAAENLKAPLDELRLRADGVASATQNGRSVRLGVSCTREELKASLERVCSGSLHSYGESIKNGYIDLGGGWRAGVCGEGVVEEGRLVAVRGVSSICIRVPHFLPGVSGKLYDRLTSGRTLKSCLVYSTPGEGKTTLLRDLAYRLSRGERPYRVALVDTRGELYDAEHMKNGLLDVYAGYPKPDAIELATRTMNPECIVCDELGGAAETEALLAAQNTGVPLIASAHAESLGQLLKRPNLRVLHEAGMFALYAGIRRREGAYDFAFTAREENDAV